MSVSSSYRFNCRSSLCSVTSPTEIPATISFTGTPASISASIPPHTLAIEVDPLDSMISLEIRIAYRKSFSLGTIGSSERSASAPCPSTRSAGLADTERWKIVMQNETLRSYSATVGVDVLRFFDWCERHEGERLGFAALENGRSVRAWQHAHFTRNRSQVLVTAAVDSLFLVQNADAKRFLLDVIECLRD